MPDLNALIIFAKVVEANSFSEAARRLKMPISTVSRRIADLENELGVRLLERSTRSLRLTDLGADILQHAQRSAELSEVVANTISNQLAHVAGLLRLSAPPSLSDTFLTPLATAFQASYPHVRMQILVTDRLVDNIAEGVDLAFRVGPLKDSSLVTRRLLTYRHQLVASPDYIKASQSPERPRDLLNHRLFSFPYPYWEAEKTWEFIHRNGRDREDLTFQPYFSMNDYAGIATAVAAGAGIGDLPPVSLPNLLRDGRLVEIMPEWRFRNLDLWMVHLGAHHMAKHVRVFKDFATQMAPTLFPDLPC